MRKNLFIILITITFTSCSTYQSILSKETQLLIPQGANKVVLYSTLPPENLFNDALNMLITENFRITNENKDIGYISTEGKKVREGILMRLSIKISGENDSSILTSSAEVMLDAVSMATLNAIIGTNVQQEWQPVISNEIGEPNFPYEKMVDIIQKLPHKEIHFVKE